MKKICFVTTVSITLQSFVLKTAEYLHSNTDWEISFICSDDSAFANNLPEYIHYYPVHMERGISFGGIQAMLEIKKIFKKEKFDLVQYSTPNASLYASIAAKMTGVPVRLYCQWGMAYVGFEGLKRKIFRLVEKFVCSLSTWVEPDSNSNLAFAHSEKLYPKWKGSVVGNGSACGVDLSKFNVSKRQEYRKKIREKFKLNENDFVFGFVGRITRDKGINELLAAFQAIQNKYPNAYLMMVGINENDSTIDDDLFVWSKGSDRVIYSGVTNVVEQYLSAMDTFILPSYREGFGMGVVEAEAMGVPVIVTNIPGPTDAMIDGETGIVVEKKSVTSLLKAMNKLLDNEGLVASYSKNAIELVARKFEQKQLFEKILEDRRMLLKV